MRRKALVICALAALSGCGGDEREDVDQTVRDFVTATRERDAEKFCDELVTQEFLEQTTGATGDQAAETCKREFNSLSGLRVDLVRIVRTEVEDDRATVETVLRRQGTRVPLTFRLRNEDGEWKLAGGGE